MKRSFFLLGACAIFGATAGAERYSYDGAVSHDVARDRIIIIAEDYYSLEYYVGDDNIDDDGVSGATVPDSTTGWKTGMKYCWGGEDSPAIFLRRLEEGDLAGNRNTSGSSSYDLYATGADCSGMSSNCWTSGRYATSGIPSISDDIEWEDLRMGDATNKAGSHVRVFDYWVEGTGTLMIYESTGSGWKARHRPLSRDDSYTPVRYNASSYEVIDHPEPVIQSVLRTGTEHFAIRWDGQADSGFRLETSTDGQTWVETYGPEDLTPSMRTCEVSGVLPHRDMYFRLIAVNGTEETVASTTVAARDDGYAPRVLLVDGHDRYRRDHSPHQFNLRAGAALGTAGIGFDFAANELVVNGLVNLANYDAVVWLSGEDSTFDETFSWPEQKRLTDFVDGGGNLFVSGAEIGWDIDYKADTANTWNNGHENDRNFYMSILGAQYDDDDADTYTAQGAAGSIFEGISLEFDNGTHGTYDVAYPDMLTPIQNAAAVMTYTGGNGGTAGIAIVHASGAKVVNLGFPFETIVQTEHRTDVMKAVIDYFELPLTPPTITGYRLNDAGDLEVVYEGYAPDGFATRVTENGRAKRGTLADAIPGINYEVRVEALRGQEAVSSNTYVARVNESGPRVLLVDGMDRWSGMQADPLASHDYVAMAGRALGARGIAHESCANESVTAGEVPLEDYDAVIWLLGEESTESETFSVGEQSRVRAYLEQGGKLFVSGSEIAWDLEYKADSENDYWNGSPGDQAFLNDYLKAAYVADNAGTNEALGTPDSPFERLGVTFGEAYEVGYPDVLSPLGGSAACLTYGSGSDVAGVCYTGPFGGGSVDGCVVYLGFPFETIQTSGRQAVMDGIIEYFGLEATVTESHIRSVIEGLHAEDPECDVNGDGVIDAADLMMLRRR